MFEHGTYVFAAYGVTFGVLLWCALAPALRFRRVRARLAVLASKARAENT